ncbi:MAG: type II secretion system protein GspG [bacterium]
MHRFIMKTAALLVLLVFVSVPQATCDISALDRYLPADTMFYLVVKDVDAAKEAAHKTAFYEVWDSEGMKKLRDEISGIWTKTVVDKIEIDPLTFVQAIKKDAVLGAKLRFDPVVGLPQGVSFSIVLAVEDPEGEIGQIIPSIKELLAEEGDSAPNMKTLEHGDAEVLSLQLESAELSLAALPDTFLFCFGDPGLVTTLIDQGAEEDPSGFPASEMYPSLLGLHQEGDLSLAWLDWASLVATAQSFLGTAVPKMDPAVLMSHLGIDNLSSFFLRAYVDHRGFLRQQIVEFDGPIHGLIRFFLNPGELAAIERFTPDTDLAMDLSIGSLEETWQRLNNMIVALWGEQALTGMTTGVQAFETMLGFSFEKELFPSIGNELAMGFQGEQVTLLLQVLNEEKIVELIPKLLLIWELQPEPMEVEGTKYNRIELTDAGIALFYGIDKGYLVVSNSPEGYLAAVKEADKKESILDSRRYGKPLSYLPPATSFITVTDLRGMANYTATMMALQQAFSGDEVPGSLDLSFLGDETFPIVDTGVVQEDRFIRWSYSESGMEGVLTMFSTLKTISQQMKHFERGRKGALTARSEAEMRSLKMALESYFIDNSRYPETLDQLVEPIAYLSSVPSDPWTGEPYIYRQRENTYILISAGPDGRIDFDVESIEGPFAKDKIPEDARYNPDSGPGGDIIVVGP